TRCLAAKPALTLFRMVAGGDDQFSSRTRGRPIPLFARTCGGSHVGAGRFARVPFARQKTGNRQGGGDSTGLAETRRRDGGGAVGVRQAAIRRGGRAALRPGAEGVAVGKGARDGAASQSRRPGLTAVRSNSRARSEPLA